MYGKSEYILKKSLKCTAWCICLCNLLYVVHSNRNIFNYLQPSFSCYMTTVITFHSVELVSKILKVQRNKEYVTLQNCFWKHILLEKFLWIFLHQTIKQTYALTLKDAHHQLLQYYMVTLTPILRVLLAILRVQLESCSCETFRLQ